MHVLKHGQAELENKDKDVDDETGEREQGEDDGSNGEPEVERYALHANELAVLAVQLEHHGSGDRTGGGEHDLQHCRAS